MNPYFNFEYLSDQAPDSIMRSITSTEFQFKLRFAHREKFIIGKYRRISLESKKPIVTIQYGAGVKNVWNSQFQYHRLGLTVTDYFFIHPLGESYVGLKVGKIFGDVPYLLMEVYDGNEGFFYQPLGFNMMKEFEFAADQYAMLFYDHHFDGLFFDRIPLVRKLKLRSVASAKVAYGSSMSNSNQLKNSRNLFDNTNETDVAVARISVPDRVPYVEVGVDIENILQLIRVDAVYRATYQRKGLSNIGVRIGMDITL